MMLVVPPQAAARVPVSKVSEAAVPPNGSSMWVCASMPPGITYLPVASTTWSTSGRQVDAQQCRLPGASTAAICSPSTSTSAYAVPVALTTVPPLISVVVIFAPPLPVLRELPTGCRIAVPRTGVSTRSVSLLRCR